MPEAELITVKEFQDRELLGDYVAPVDLQNALELCGRMDEKIMKELPDDYYLFQFSDKELREILVRSFEWNSLDVMLAKKLLTERGVPFSEEKIAEERQEITDELDAPEKENTLIVVCGYIFCVFGGLLGLMLALLILNSKKTTHDGHRVHRYNAASRGHARNMLLIFIVVIILTLFFVGAQLG